MFRISLAQEVIFNSMNNFLLNFDLLEENKKEENAFTYKVAQAKKAGKETVKINGKEIKVKMSDDTAKEILDADEIKAESGRDKRRPGKTDYYKGTSKSNAQMSKEIKKCAKNPKPASCYDEWTADKTYKKSKGVKESRDFFVEDILNESLEEILFEVLEEKKTKAKKLAAKTRETLKKKAEKSNMPLGALTSVYRKGLAAWLSGHRQGIPQHAWAMARVNSFIRGGKTRSVDKGEWKRVQKHRKK